MLSMEVADMATTFPNCPTCGHRMEPVPDANRFHCPHCKRHRPFSASSLGFAWHAASQSIQPVETIVAEQAINKAAANRRPSDQLDLPELEDKIQTRSRFHRQTPNPVSPSRRLQARTLGRYQRVQHPFNGMGRLEDFDK